MKLPLGIKKKKRENGAEFFAQRVSSATQAWRRFLMRWFDKGHRHSQRLFCRTANIASYTFRTHNRHHRDKNDRDTETSAHGLKVERECRVADSSLRSDDDLTDSCFLTRPFFYWIRKRIFVGVLTCACAFKSGRTLLINTGKRSHCFRHELILR